MIEQHSGGFHGATSGNGILRVAGESGAVVWVEYSYQKHEDGSFAGSISTWKHESDGAGLVAYMSRAMPTRQAMLNWIYAKAEKLTG
jgi:hypothetical protein